MMLFDFEDRIIATDSIGSRGFAWAAEQGRWLEVAPSFASKVWVEGRELTEAEATRRFKGVDFNALELSKLRN